MSRQERWNERYESGQTPWDTGFHDGNLEKVIVEHHIEPGRALDIGCGTGTNAIWLAERGFTVTGLDIAAAPIEAACAKRGSGSNPEFLVLDLITAEDFEGPFDFVFDRGCFHSHSEPGERGAFVLRVHDLMAPDGIWCSLIGSADGPEREVGPPRLSLREVVGVVEPLFEVLELRASHFDSKQGDPARCWVGVFRPRLK